MTFQRLIDIVEEEEEEYRGSYQEWRRRMTIRKRTEGMKEEGERKRS